MSLVAVADSLSPYGDMPTRNKKAAPSDAVRGYAEAVKRLRNLAGISQEAAAAELRQTKQSWQGYESGNVQAILRVDVQERVAAAIGVTREQLEDEKDKVLGLARHAIQTGLGKISQDSRLPIRGRVQAGAWLASDDTVQVEPKLYPFSPDPRYPFAGQWLSEVVGDSVDKLGIFEGDLVHCIDAKDIGYYPKTGDVVEAERIRFDGREHEISLKQVEVTAHGVLMWPRSTNSRWREPLSPSEGASEEGVLVQVRSIVVASLRRFFT